MGLRLYSIIQYYAVLYSITQQYTCVRCALCGVRLEGPRLIQTLALSAGAAERGVAS